MKNGAKPTTSQVNVGQFQGNIEQFAKEGKALLYVAFIGLIWDLSELQSWHEPGFRRLPGGRDQIVDPKGGWDWKRSYLVMRAVAARDTRPFISSQGRNHGLSAKTADLFPRR